MVLSSQRSNNQFDCKDEEELLSTHKKGRKLWRKVKYQLTEYHALPAFLRDNEYILGHYRSEWPLKQVLLSIFTIHNETLNVWTHLIGFFLFLSLTIYTAMKVPDVVDRYSLQHTMLMKCLPSLPDMTDFSKLRDELKATLPSINSLLEHLSHCLPERLSLFNQTSDHFWWTMKEDVIKAIAPLTFHPITRWPFYAFLGGAMFCLLASSTCHLLSCHSERLSYIMLRLDYAVFQNPEFRAIRASLFFGMGVSGAAPILHKLILYWNQPEALQTTGYELLMGALYGIGALIYAMRIPERWRPGKFDIAGHSHQLFHILVVAGAYTHYHAGLVYLKWRDVHGC